MPHKKFFMMIICLFVTHHAHAMEKKETPTKGWVAWATDSIYNLWGSSEEIISDDYETVGSLDHEVELTPGEKKIFDDILASTESLKSEEEVPKNTSDVPDLHAELNALFGEKKKKYKIDESAFEDIAKLYPEKTSDNETSITIGSIDVPYLSDSENLCKPPTTTKFSVAKKRKPKKRKRDSRIKVNPSPLQRALKSSQSSAAAIALCSLTEKLLVTGNIKLTREGKEIYQDTLMLLLADKKFSESIEKKDTKKKTSYLDIPSKGPMTKWVRKKK